MQLSLRGAAKALGLKSPSLLSRMKADSRLDDYLVRGEGPKAQDLIETEPVGKVPLATFVASYRRGAGGPSAEDADDEAILAAGGIPSTAFSTRRRRHYEAKLRQLEVGMRTGVYLSAKDVQRRVFTALRALRDRTTAIGPRVVPQVVSMIGPLSRKQEELVRQVVEREIRDGLTDAAGIPLTGPSPPEVDRSGLGFG